MAHGRRRFQRRFLLFACRCGIRAFRGGRAPVFALLLFCAVCISGFLGDTCEVPFGNHSRRCLRCYWLSGWIEFFFGPSIVGYLNDLTILFAGACRLSVVASWRLRSFSPSSGLRPPMSSKRLSPS